MSIKRNNSPGYFFFLSGENPELAFFELESIILTLDSKLSLNRTSDPRIITLTIEEALVRKKENKGSIDEVKFVDGVWAVSMSDNDVDVEVIYDTNGKKLRQMTIK